MKADTAEHIFFDLDGTLVDNSARLYACYCAALGADATNRLDNVSYMIMKRDRRLITDILHASGSKQEAHVFHDKWMALVETAPYLALDVLKPGVIPALESARHYGRRVALLTKRRHRPALLEQLQTFGIAHLFDEVITPPSNKSETLRALGVFDCVVVGDTEEDADAARAVGAVFVGITTGLRVPSLLSADFLHEQVADINWQAVIRVMNGPVS